MNIEHISVSRKQLWDSCQLAYKYKYHLKVPVNTPTQPHFIYGSLVHKIAEVYVEKQGQVPIEQIASDCLSGNIVIKEGESPPSLDKYYKNKLPEHIKNIKTMSDQIGFDGQLEWPFDFDLNPPKNYFITGFIDRLIIRGDKYYILDYKTTKKGFWRKNKNTIKKDLQLRCYARVVQKQFNVKAENIKAALYYLEGGDLISTGFDQESLMTAEEEMYDAYEQILLTHPDDAYGRVGDQCKRCDYRSICTYYSLT